MRLRFLGGAQSVTGSKTLVTSGKHHLLVDCGLFQGLKSLRLKNWEPFPLEPRRIDSVLLTHAHLDHSGYLPLLTRNGFHGKIFCSAPTRDLTELILKDSARLQEEDAHFANQHGFSKHQPAEPLYTEKDAKAAIDRIVVLPPGRWFDLPGQMRFQLLPSSHILGSTFVVVESEGCRIVFSGDLGRLNPLLYSTPALLENADYLVMESTYGDRTHHLPLEKGEISGRLAHIICETFQKGGQVILPSFAVGRTQDLLFLLAELKDQKRIPELPLYLDSPMGVNASQIFYDHPKWHVLTPWQVERILNTSKMLKSQEESIQVMRKAAPAVIIAGSGMLTGGRVLHHLAARLPDDRNTILLAGYQAAGTRGRLLQEGISELKIHGKYIPVRARVEIIAGLSAHADQSEMITWLKGFKAPPKMTFLNHGEPQASDALRVKIRDILGWRCQVPQLLQEFQLTPDGDF